MNTRYMHFKSLQKVYNPLQNKFQSLSNEYNKQQVIADPNVRNQRQGETLNSMIQMKDDIRQQLVQVSWRAGGPRGAAEKKDE